MIRAEELEHLSEMERPAGADSRSRRGSAETGSSVRTLEWRRTPFTKFDAPELTDKNPGFNKTIGGSSIATILGFNPWESPYELWLRLLGRVSPTPDNAAMERGRRFEDPIAQMFAASHPDWEVTHENPATQELWFVRDSVYPYLTGQPDRMIHGPNGYFEAGLEIKTASASSFDKWGAAGTDQVPLNYLLQCLHYGGLMGGLDWYLKVLFFKDDGAGQGEKPYLTRDYFIKFDPELYEEMRAAAVDFWENNILTQEPPEMTASGTTFSRYLKEAFPRNVEPMGETTPEEDELIQKLLEADKKAKEAEAELTLIQDRVKAMIGPREGLNSPFAKITWKNTKDRETTDWRNIAEEQAGPEGVSAELRNKWTTRKSGARTFLVRPKTKEI